MQPVADALRAVLSRVPRLHAETVALDAARGRILAEDIVAARALPGYDNSAMDGYAARSRDLPGELTLLGIAAAGHPFAADPSLGCTAIYTGAMVPPGYDTVVIEEDAAFRDEHDGSRYVTLPASPPGANIRRAGEDVAIGEPVLRAGTRIGPWEIGIFAALGVSRVAAARAPRVALIATGDELVDIAAEPQPGQLVDSSVHALAAQVALAGGVAEHVGTARDDIGSLVALLERARGYDAIVTTGGVSVGGRDHVRTALGAAGIDLQLYKVAMKPGKPFSFGVRANTDGRSPVPLFGLPGNPVSTAVAFELFVRPALLAMQGASVIERPRAPVQLAGGYRKSAGRAHYLRATVARDGERLVARAHPKQGSAMLSSLLGCNALVEIAADATEVAAGGVVSAMLLEAV